MVLLDVARNIAVLLALCMSYTLIFRTWDRRSLSGQILAGVTFGIATVIGMLTPMKLSPGIIFDGRSILISVAGLLSGGVSATLAAGIAGACRIALGGNGVYMGCGVIVTSALLGTGYHYLRRGRPPEIKTSSLYVFGMVVHVAMLMWTAALPYGLRWSTLQTIALPVMLAYPVGTVLVGRLLADQDARTDAEKHARESEERYRAIAEAATVLICRFLPGGEITYANKAYCNYFGKTAEELVGSSLFLLIPESDRESVRAAMASLSAESPCRTYEHRVVAPGGETRWQRWTDRALFDDGGRVAAFQSVGEDVTERKRAEEELASFNQAMVGREARIMEMKRKVNALAAELGREPIYDEDPGPDPEPLILEPQETEPAASFDPEAIRLADLFDIGTVEHLLKSFCDSTGVASAIIDRDGNLLVSTNWQRVCTDFHRINEQTRHQCIESDTSLANQLKEQKPYAIYRCRNGMIDAAAPILIQGRHIANVFVGQFHTEPPDEQAFRAQARQFGFDEEEYIRALHEAPIIPEEKLPPILDFLCSIAEICARMGLDRARDKQALLEIKHRQDALAQQRRAALNLLEDARRAEEALRKSEEARRDFGERLARLHEVTNELSACISLDQVWRRAIELGRGKLGFDRLGIWLTEGGPDVLRGTYGTDVQGGLQKQSTLGGSVDPESSVAHALGMQTACYYSEHDPVMNDANTEVIGHAARAVAPLWNGTEVVGIISTDNYIEQRPITKNDQRLLTLYASVLGHLHERFCAEDRRFTLERQIQQAQKLESLGILAGGIAHDFNNILMAILGNADLVLDTLSPHAPARENVLEIERASKHAAELAKQMLAYSGKGRFVVERINLNEFVGEMAHLLEVSISKKVVLKYSFADTLPSFEGDATQIRQVIMNLITNASEAIGGQSGVIALSTGAMYCDQDYLQDIRIGEPLPEGTYVYVEVADTGCGMEKETQEKIFDPFFTTKFTGRGLGLAATLGIVRGHKGAIKIYSEPGRGTTFKILFPAVERPAEQVSEVPEKERRAETVSASGLSGTVLIVDDEKTVRMVGGKMLERLGFSVLTAADGREAVEVFREHSAEIACVLLDLTMPHMDGEETFRELRQVRPDTKVILCSGYSEPDATQRFAGKGLEGFIQKPYQMAGLREKLQQVLGVEA